eukprot:scaffold268_cov140-Skeletonema_menzelii.AAC.9
MQTKSRGVDTGRTEEMPAASSKASFSKLSSSGPLAKSYCLALSTALLSAAAFCCLLASGLSCSFLSVSLSNQVEVIDFNMTNILPEDQWYFNELLSEGNNALSVGILCHGELDWLAPNTSDNSMRLLSKVFLIVALALGGLLLMVTCGISTVLPTSNLLWDGISYIAAGLFVCEMPIFFLLDSPPCNNSKGMFSCQLASGSYTLICSMACSLSLAILTQWKNTPDWKEEYEIWNLRKMNEQMSQQPGVISESKTPEENSNDYEDEEMAMGHQQQLNLREQPASRSQDEPAEIGVEIRVEKVPSPERPQRSSRAIDQKGNHQLMGQVIDLNRKSKPQDASATKPSSPSRSQAPSVDTEVYGSDHGRNVMKEPNTPECQFRANGMRPVSPLSICTGLSDSPMDRPSPVASPTDNNISNITDKATFMENEAVIMKDPNTPDFASAYLVRMPAKVAPSKDDVSVHSSSKQSVSSKQSIVSLMREKLWKSSNDGEVLGRVLDGDREEVQESWMVEDVSIGNSAEISFVDKTTPHSVKPQARAQPQQVPPSPNAVESDTEKDIAGLIVPGMISQMKQQIANKALVSPERVHDPDLDMYPSESSVSELSLPNVEDEEYIKRIEEEYLRLKKNKPAEPILNLPLNYKSESSGGESELDQVIAGVQRINRKISGKITPLNRRARRRRTGGGSVSGDSYSSAQGSLLDEVIVEEGENQSTEISVGSGGIPNVISPEMKTRKSRRNESILRVTSSEYDDGYQNEQSAEEDDDVQSVTSSVASARRYRLSLNRKASVESDGTPKRKSKSSKLEEFLDSDVSVSKEEKVKLLQEALNRLQKSSSTDQGYSSAAKSVTSQRSLTRLNQRYDRKAETVDLPLNVRNTPHAQDVNTGAAPTSERSGRDSAWQARKARLKRLRMLRAEEANDNDSTDEVIRANAGIVVCSSDEGSI